MPSLADLRARIASGALTPDAALRQGRESIAAREPEVAAFARLAPETPAGKGPLAGIAVAVKDIIDTADLATEMGAPTIYGGWRPRADAAVVATLRRLGATVIGKTETTAFATADPARTVNPHDPAHTPGGSSAGSAAAVGAGMVPLALGTQTAGSVIRPASFCGAAAIKPSFRLIPTVGVKCLAWTLDTVGLFAAGAADLAEALELVTGRPMSEPRTGAPRLGVVRQLFAGAPDPDGEAALDEAASRLSAAGAVLVDLDVAPSLAEAWAAHPTIMEHEAAAALAWEYESGADRLPPSIRGVLERGRAIGGSSYDDARRTANRARRDSKQLFASVDALVTYAAPGTAPRGLDWTGDPRFNRLWTLLGTPCVSVPGLRGRGSLPIGTQVVAPFGRDALALEVARFVERAIRPAAG